MYFPPVRLAACACASGPATQGPAEVSVVSRSGAASRKCGAIRGHATHEGTAWGQSFRVSQRANRGDGAVGDRERHDGDRPPAHRDEDARDTVDEHRMDPRARARARGDRRPGRDLARAAYHDGALGTLRPEFHFGGEHGEQSREVAPAGRCEERVDDLPGRRVRSRRRRTQAKPSASPAG
jgi:hypothetical protein